MAGFLPPPQTVSQLARSNTPIYKIPHIAQLIHSAKYNDGPTDTPLFDFLNKTDEQECEDGEKLKQWLRDQGLTGSFYKDWPEFLTASFDTTNLDDSEVKEWIAEHTDPSCAQLIYDVWSAGTLRLCDAINWIFRPAHPGTLQKIYSKIHPLSYFFAVGLVKTSQAILHFNAGIGLYNWLQASYNNIHFLGTDPTLWEIFMRTSQHAKAATTYSTTGFTYENLSVTCYNPQGATQHSTAALSHPHEMQLAVFEGNCTNHNIPKGLCSFCALKWIFPLEQLADGILDFSGPIHDAWSATLELMENAANVNSEGVLSENDRGLADYNAHMSYCDNVLSTLTFARLAGYKHPDVLWIQLKQKVTEMERCLVQYGIWPRLKTLFNGKFPVCEALEEDNPIPLTPAMQKKIAEHINRLPGSTNQTLELECFLSFKFLASTSETPIQFNAGVENALFHGPVPELPILTNTLVQHILDINGGVIEPCDEALYKHLVSTFRYHIRDCGGNTCYESYLMNLIEWFTCQVLPKNPNSGVAEPISSFLYAASHDGPWNTSMEEPTGKIAHSVFMSLHMLITKHFGSDQMETRRYAAVASSLVSLGIAIYNVIKLSTAEQIDKTALTLNAVLIATSAFTTYSAICDAVNSAMFGWIKEKITRILCVDGMDMDMDDEPTEPGQFDDASPTSAALPKVLVKIVSVLGVAIASACGLKAPGNILKDVGTSLRAADTTVESVATLLSEVFDLDVDGSAAEQKILEDTEKKGQEYLSMTTSQWSTGGIKNEIEKWLTLANNLIRKPSKTKTNYSRLSAITLDISKRLADIERIRTTGKERPVPSAIWLYGEPGRGKTDFVFKYLIPHLAATFGVSGDTYDLGTGKYSMPLLNQRWAVYDEAGAKSVTDDSVLGRLNNLLSSAPCVLPGAEVENKNQVANFSAVIFMSNLRPSEVNFNMNANAKTALLSRLMVFEVTDPFFQPNVPRDQQNHRQADYSHLRFADSDAIYKPSELLHIITSDIYRKSAYYRNTMDKALDVDTIHQCRLQFDDGFRLPDPFNVESEQATSKTPFTICLSGPAGSRKTTQWAPEFIKAFDHFGFLPEYVPPHTTPKNIRDKIVPGKRTLWIMDDLFDLTANQDCQELLMLLNAIPEEDIVLLLTNYVPATLMGYLPTILTGITAKQVSLASHPGLARRLGFDKDRPESIHVNATATDISFTHSKDKCTISSVVSRYLRYTNRTCFVEHVPSVPAIIPFTSEEADIFVSLTTTPALNSAAELFSRGKFSLRTIPIIVGMWKKIGKDCWFTAVKRELLNGALMGMKDAKIYVSVPGKKFMYYKNKFYTDENSTDFAVTFSEPLGMGQISSTAYPDGKQLITRDQFVSYQTQGKPHTDSADDITVFSALSELEKENGVIWKKIVDSRKYRLTMSELLDMHHRIGQARLVAWYTVAKQYWQIPAFIGFTALAAPLLWKLVSRGSEPMIVQERCPWCVKRQLCPTIEFTQKLIEQDQIEVTAKGGRKGKLNRAGATLGNPKKFHFNNQFFVVSGADADLSDNPTLERLYHDFHRRLQAGDVVEKDDHWFVDLPSHGTAKAYARLAKAGGDWKIHMDEGPTNDPNLMTYANNVCRAETDQSFTVTLLDGTYGVTSAHCVEHVGQCLTVYADEPHSMVVLSIDRMHELAFLVAIDSVNNPKIIPNIKSMLPILCKRSEIPTHGYATVLTKREGRYGAFTNKFTIQTVPCPMITAEKIRLWKEDAGIVSWGSALQPVTYGDSGAPIFMMTKTGIRFIGVQAATKQSICQFLFAVVSKEHLEEATTSDEKAPEPEMLVPLENQDCTSQTCYDAGITVLLHEGFAQRIKPKRCFEMYLEGNAGQIGGVKNPLPMDTQNDKRPLAEHLFAPIFGNLKAPAIPVLRTAIDHADKIPPDSHGLRAPEHIKMCKLSSGFSVPEDIAYLTATAATTLAGYYKMQYGVDFLEPLSVDKAVNGTTPDKKLEMDSSTGAAFQVMFPGNPTKERLFVVDSDPNEPIHRRIQNSLPGIWLKNAIDEQWDLAKKGVVKTLPASASFKSELLPLEKVWKKRIVFVCDTATVINQKRVLQPIMDTLTKDGPLSDFQLCMNPYRDFDAIGRRLQKTSTDGILSLDFKDFDLTVPGEVLLACGMFCAEFYSTESRSLRKAIISLVAAIGATPILAGESLYSKAHGMLSGVYGTSLLDCLAVKIMLYVVTSQILEYEELMPVEDFFENITSVGCGDDTTISVHHQVRDKINFSSLSASFKELYNMTITGDTKDGSEVKFTEITEASFCSRRWVVHPTHPQVLVSRLKPEAMSGALCWTAFPTDVEAKTQLEAMRAEFVGWGKEKFLAFERMFRHFCKLNGQEYIPITWETLSEEAYSAIVAENMPKHISTDLKEIPKTKDFKPDVNTVSSKIMSILGPVNPADMDVNMYPQNRRLAKIRAVFEDSSTLEEFVDCKLAQSLKQTVVLNSVVTRNIYSSTTEYQFIDPINLQWFQQLVLAFPGELIVGLHTVADSTVPTPAEPGPKYRRYKKDKELARAILICLGNRKCKTAFLHLKGLIMPEHCSGRGTPAPGGDQPTVRANAPTVASGPTLGAVTVAPAVVSEGTPVAPDAVPFTGTAPPVLIAAPGIDGSLAPNTGYFRDVASYLYTPYIVQNLSATTSTSEGTLIGTWDFDPWDENLVGPMIKKYADLHDTFVGSLTVKFQMPSVAMVSGRLAYFFVPGPHVDSVKPNIQSLSKYAGFVMDVTNTTGTGTDWELVISPSSNSEFVVTRDGVKNKRYGRLYLLAYTLIQNSYGSNSVLPITMYACLAPNSAYSNPVDAVQDVTYEIPPLPVEATTMSVDGLYPLPAVDHSDVVQLTDAHASDADRRQWMIAAVDIDTGASTPRYEVVYQDVAKQNASMNSTTDITVTASGTGKSYAYIAEQDALDNGYDHIVYTGAVANIIHQGPNWGFRPVENNRAVDITIAATKKAVNAVDGPRPFFRSFTGQGVYNMTGVPATTTYQNFPVGVKLTGNIRATIGIQTSRVGIPAGYKRVAFVGEEADLPSVVKGTAGVTLLPEAKEYAVHAQDDEYFTKNPGIGSIITTLTTGNTRVQVVRNKLGWWVYAPNVPDYANFTSIPNWEQYSVPSANEWPVIAPVAPTNFTTRLVNADGTAMAGLMLGGGLLAGLGQGMAAYATAENQNKQLVAQLSNSNQQMMYSTVNANNMARYNMLTNRYMDASSKKIQDEWALRSLTFQNMNQKRTNDFNKQMFMLSNSLQSFGTVSSTRTSTLGTETSGQPAHVPTGTTYQAEVDDDDQEMRMYLAGAESEMADEYQKENTPPEPVVAPLPIPTPTVTGHLPYTDRHNYNTYPGRL